MTSTSIGDKGCTLQLVLQLVIESEEFLEKSSEIDWGEFLNTIQYANSSLITNKSYINALKKNNDPRQLMEEVLTRWTKRHKDKATLSILVDALENIGLIDTARHLNDRFKEQSLHHPDNSISKPLNLVSTSTHHRSGIWSRTFLETRNESLHSESDILRKNPEPMGLVTESPAYSNKDHPSNKFPISVSREKRGIRRIKMSIYFVSTIILVSIAMYQVIVLAAHGKFLTRLQHLAELPEQLKTAKNDLIFLSKEMVRTWNDWNYKHSQTKYLTDSAHLMTPNNGYLHLHKDFDWPLDPPLENAALISEITLVDCMNITNFFRMLKDTSNIVKLNILNTNKCSQDTKQCYDKIDEKTSFVIINELHGLQLVSTDKLKSLTISNSLWFPYIIKAFAERISTGNLETLRIKNDALSSDDINRLQILLSVNKKTLTTFFISTTEWNSVLFSQEFAVLSNVRNVFINSTTAGLVNTTTELGKGFCLIFPNVENVISSTGYVTVDDLVQIFECRSLVSLTLGVKVRRGQLKFNDVIPTNVSRSLKHVRLNIHFDERPCGVITDNEYQEPRSFRLFYNSNCL